MASRALLTNEEIRTFLSEAEKAGYASGEEGGWTKEPDGSTTIAFQSGDWRFHDNFFGGEPYGGREVVFHGEHAVWMMVYYGWIEDTERDVKSIYGFLQQALRGKADGAQIRGPMGFDKGELKYLNQCTGDLDQFEGQECIYRKEKVVYRGRYAGGLVDQRGEG